MNSSLFDETSDSYSAVAEEYGAEEEQVEEVDEFVVFLNEEIESCFALFDKKKMGEFDLAYLKKALLCLGLPMSETEFQEFQEAVDTNGIVLFNKFQAACLEKLKQQDPCEALKIAFKAFDLNEENTIHTDMFKKWMTTLGDPLTEKEAKDLAKLGDPGKKGAIVYDDLAVLLTYSKSKI